ncbi:hypothetical protein CMK19_12715 [Candidatus Poribacteria bacterium]|nr:hypothetical protein [Candidatus Poribacteria bacterium]
MGYSIYKDTIGEETGFENFFHDTFLYHSFCLLTYLYWQPKGLKLMQKQNSIVLIISKINNAPNNPGHL